MSPYRTAAPRPAVTPPRRGFLDTCRRLQRMWRHARRWNFTAGYAELLCALLPPVLLVTAARGSGWGWLVGLPLIIIVPDLGLDDALLGYLRAKRCRWFMRQTPRAAPTVTIYPAIRIFRKYARREIDAKQAVEAMRRLCDQPCKRSDRGHDVGMQIATVRYQVATYSGEVTVYGVDPNVDNEHIICRARGQLARRAGGSLPFGSESWRVVRREDSGE